MKKQINWTLEIWALSTFSNFPREQQSKIFSTLLVIKSPFLINHVDIYAV